MNTTTAREIVCKVAHLAGLAATYTARFGTHYRICIDSTEEACTLYGEILAVQSEIAALLDPEALQTPYSRYGEWWKRMDVMDTAMVNELASEGFNLIGRCAYLGVHEKTRWTNSDLVLQRSIAGLLHPNARQADASELVRKAI
jgi:hypothetical protein